MIDTDSLDRIRTAYIDWWSDQGERGAVLPRGALQIAFDMAALLESCDDANYEEEEREDAVQEAAFEAARLRAMSRE